MKYFLFVLLSIICLSCGDRSGNKSDGGETSTDSVSKKTDTLVKNGGEASISDARLKEAVLKAFTPPITFSYATQGGTPYSAEIFKEFKTGDPNPKIRFRHTNLVTGQTHPEDFIDYVTDDRRTFRAWIYYDYGKQELYFDHAQRNGNFVGKPFRSDHMNFLDPGSCFWQLSFEKCTPDQIRDNSQIVPGKKILVSCPKPPAPINRPVTGTGGLYTIDYSNQNSWVVTFQTNTTILFHPSRDYYPASQLSFYRGNQLRVAPGQWVQVYLYINGGYYWSLATDLDRRNQ